MPDLRASLNLSHDIDPAFDAIRREVPKDATILCIETYETFYHTGRRATWPIPYGQKDPPIEFFFDREPEQILTHLRAHGIDYLLVPPRSRGEAFNSANFPRPFMLGLGRLIEEKWIVPIFEDPRYVLLRLVPAADGAGGRP